VAVQVKSRVVGPERPAATGRRPVQPLPEPGHRTDPLTQQLPGVLNAEARPRAQHHHRTDVHRREPDIHSQLHQVGRAGPLHRHPSRLADATQLVGSAVLPDARLC
jgi:hypothetical protein